VDLRLVAGLLHDGKYCVKTLLLASPRPESVLAVLPQLPNTLYLVLMSDALVSGLFALGGAIVGVLLSGWLRHRLERGTAKTARVQASVRSLAIALSAQSFPFRIGDFGPKIPAAEIASAEREIYLKGIERYFVALSDARRDLAILAADGLAVGDEWRNDQALGDSLQIVYERVSSIHRGGGEAATLLE